MGMAAGATLAKVKRVRSKCNLVKVGRYINIIAIRRMGSNSRILTSSGPLLNN